LKVLHVIPGLGVRTGGPATSVVQSSLALAAQGIETTIFATDLAGSASARPHARARPEDLPRGASKLDVRLFPSRTPYRLAFSPALDRALMREISVYDVVHIHSLFLFPQFSAYRGARRAGRPYVVSPRGALDPHLRGRGRLRKAATAALWQRRMLERATTLHLTTEEEARVVADVAPAVPRAVVPNGIAWSRYQDLPDNEVFRREHLGGHEGPVILSLGRLSHVKGLDILVCAFALVSRNFPEARLVIAGPDDERLTSPLTTLAEREGVGERILFTGMLRGEAKLAALASADVWASPSHSENFGVAAAEALASGLATVLSPAVKIAPEAAAEHATLLAEPTVEGFAADLVELLADDRRRNELGARARAFARRYDWSVVGPQLAALYADAVGNGGLS
jgi:glycosyltransferase involved in cell wall biosynthesis